MADILILSEAELRNCVRLDHESLAAVEEGFALLARGQATVPPIMMIPVPAEDGEVDVKSAYVAGLDSFAVKIASGFFNNHQRGLPSSSGMMVVLSAVTGFPEAVLLDNGYLTDVRTALAGAIAAKYLAPETVHTLGVIGTGGQARFQARALKLVRDYRRIMVHGRSAPGRDRYAREMRDELGVDVVVGADSAAVVAGSDVVVTATPAREPLIRAADLHPGLHITAMGSDSEEKHELEPQVFARADRIVCDLKSQCFRLGELHHAVAAGVLDDDASVTELGEIVDGARPGRTRDDEVTVCDLTGVGVQDTAIARLAYRKASGQGLGLRVPA